MRLPLAVVGAVIVVATACSSSPAESSAGSHPTATLPGASAPTSVSTTPEATTTTVDPTRAAILAAYRASWTEIAAVEGRYPVNEFDPILTEHMAGDELIRVRNYATTLNHLGQYLVGLPPDTSEAIVKQQFGAAAVVADCDFDTSVVIDGRTSKVVSGAGTRRTLVNAKVELIGGVWKVTEFSTVRSGCTVAG